MRAAAFLILVFSIASAAAYAFSSSWPIGLGACKHPAIYSGLRSKDFFHDKWYVWKAYGNVLFERNHTCTGADMKIDGDRIDMLLFHYQPFLDKFLTIRGEADARYATFKGLQFPIEYDFYGLTSVSIPIAVLDTDYENWASVYFCKKLVGLKIEMSWIMLRDKKAAITEEQMSKIKNSIAGIELDINDYNLQDSSHCGDEEPHL